MDFTIFRFVIIVFFFFVTLAGIFITIGKLLSRQKDHCKKIKTINESLYIKGQPVYRTINGCEKTEKRFNESIKELEEQGKEQHALIIDKLEAMDGKQDRVNIQRNAQIEKIKLHMVKIEMWYQETHAN